MTGFLTKDAFDLTTNLPIGLAETELRRGDSVQVASFVIEQGQRAVIKYIGLTVLRYLTHGVVYDFINSGFGIAGVGVYSNGVLCSPLMRLPIGSVGTVSTDPYIETVVSTPGTYTVKVFNNTGRTYSTALDLTVSVTGSIRIYA